jgi:hypothetical protein
VLPAAVHGADFPAQPDRLALSTLAADDVDVLMGAFNAPPTDLADVDGAFRRTGRAGGLRQRRIGWRSVLGGCGALPRPPIVMGLSS